MSISSQSALCIAVLTPLLGAADSCSSTDDDLDGWSPSQGDCDDLDGSIHPEAEELCDGLDQDCDGVIDNDPRCYPDLDPAIDYYPPTGESWQTVSPMYLGWDGPALAELVDYVGEQNSTGFVMLYRGHIILERYWDGWDVTESSKIYSAGKSVVAFLTGQAQEAGQLTIEQSASSCLGDGWSLATQEQESAITLEHLLSMTSGLTSELEYEAAPGSTWYYNTEAYYRIQDCLVALNGQGMDTIARQQIYEPVGMLDSSWVEEDYQMKASTRDMARFGLLVQRDGLWNGQRLLQSGGYQSQMLSPSQDLNADYGYLWWLNGQADPDSPAGDESDGYLMPSAPADLVAALGAADKKIYSVPSMELVVVRHGSAASESGQTSTSFDDALWQKIMAAAPSNP